MALYDCEVCKDSIEERNHIEHSIMDEETKESLLTHGHNSKYGFCSFKPNCLQIFNKPIFFLVLLCIVIFNHGFAATGLNNTMLTTIEKRYGLKTTQIAMFSMSHHIIAGCFASIVCYLGHRHRPVAIALGCMFSSVGFFIISIPHYLVPPYEAGIMRYTDTCNVTRISRTQYTGNEERQDHSNYLPIFLVGYAFLGLGTTPLYSLGLAHIDENTNRKTSSMFYGFLAIASIFGPSAGYLAGNPILNIFVDIEQPPTSSLSPEDSNWVGAWWLAYLIGGLLILLPVIPLLGLPASFPHIESLREKKNQLEDTIVSRKNFKYDLKSVIPAMKSLLKNTSFIFLTLSTSMEMLTLSGFATFLPKFIETQFHKTAAASALIVGLLLIPGATLGILLGAYLCKRFQWNCQQIMKFTIVCVFLASISFTCSLIGCSGRDVVGSNVNYWNSSVKEISLKNICNEQCSCSTRYYKPVCSVLDEQTFYSPCHAGCSSESFSNGRYHNCSCLPPSNWVENGRCAPECRLFYAFTVCIFISLFCLFVVEVPTVNLAFRVVPEGQGSFAMGVQQTFTRFIGFIPASPIFGSLIDKSCKMWHIDDITGHTTSCLEYDNTKFRYYLCLLGVLSKLLSLIFLCLSYKYYRPPLKSSDEKNMELKNMEFSVN